MGFPEYDDAAFRCALLRLFTTPAAGIDAERAGALLGVSASTVRRWLSGRQRVPHATWCLVQLLASGALPWDGWDGWCCTVRWEDARRRYVHHLVCPEGGEYSPDQVRAWWWKDQELQWLRQRVRHLEAEARTPVAIGVAQARQVLREALAALDVGLMPTAVAGDGLDARQPHIEAPGPARHHHQQQDVRQVAPRL